MKYNILLGVALAVAGVAIICAGILLDWNESIYTVLAALAVIVGWQVFRKRPMGK